MHLNGGKESAALGGGIVLAGGGLIYAADHAANTGPILTFAGALIVAAIAAITANRRQDKALSAEAERQTERLDRESERLGAQLQHERRLSDIADLRHVVENALHAADDVLQAADFLHEFGSDDARHKAYTKAASRYYRSLNSLQVRLPDSDPILEATGDLLEVITATREAVAEDDQKYDAAQADYSPSYRRLVEAAKDRLASQTD